MQLPRLVRVENPLPLDQFLQRLHLPCTQDEFVPQQLLRGGSLVGILDQASCNEIFEILAEGTVQPWRSVLGDVEEDLHGVDVCKRRLAIRHLDGRDSQRPYICFEVVPCLLDDLGCHPKGGADKSVALRLDIGQLCSDAEVCKLDLSRLSQEDICSLDIAMNLAFGMKVFETK